MGYITEKAAHQHGQNLTFGLFGQSVDWMVSYPLAFIHLSFDYAQVSPSDHSRCPLVINRLIARKTNILQ